MKISSSLVCDFPQINALIINTVDTERQRYFLHRFLQKDTPLLFVGPTGTGKSAITNNFLLEVSALPLPPFLQISWSMKEGKLL